MAFLNSDGQTVQPDLPEKLPPVSPPILTSLFYFAGVLELVFGLIVWFVTVMPHRPFSIVVAWPLAVVILVALSLFGIGQAVYFMARTAVAAEHTAAAANRAAAAAERTAKATRQLAAQRDSVA